MKNLLKVERLNYTLPNGRSILEGVSFELLEGEFLGILGRNGVGKTTLMDLLLGIKPLTSGTIKILGEDPLSPQRVCLSDICFLSQDNSLKSSLSVRQFLNFYSNLYPNYSKDEEAHLLNFFSLKPESIIGSLSTGQQKKVQIVAGMSARPKIVLIDEITAVLDPETRNHFFQVLKRHKDERKLGIILATNIAEDLISRADRVFFIDNGRGESVSPSEILNLFKVEKVA
ncbi:MAG: ABC transporter ATP-binding protein [Bdellovibrionales bacterium]|nr:ABC transporter ATP-binding protein [Bdellovibrionales bacterium]